MARPVLTAAAGLALLLAWGAGGSVMAQGAAQGRLSILPPFTIWDVKLGETVTGIDPVMVGEIACGTNGGPPSLQLRSFADFAKCRPEASGLHEVYFTHDDESDYISLAQEDEYKALQGGTSIYAHPVVFSILVDGDGVARGIRVVSDERASDRERRVAVALINNLKGRYSSWNLSCEDLPPVDGQMPVGNRFEHQLCTGTYPDPQMSVRLEATYLRKKGQEALSRETQTVNKGYYESRTRLEVVQAPYQPAPTP